MSDEPGQPQRDLKSWLECEDRLAEALFRLSHEIRDSRKVQESLLKFLQDNFRNATKQDLEELGNKIMGAIEDFEQAVEERFTAIGADVDKIVESTTSQKNSLVALDKDIQGLKKEIADLANGIGDISPESKQRLANVQAKVSGIADRTHTAATEAVAVATQADSLDKQTETAPTP